MFIVLKVFVDLLMNLLLVVIEWLNVVVLFIFIKLEVLMFIGIIVLLMLNVILLFLLCWE